MLQKFFIALALVSLGGCYSMPTTSVPASYEPTATSGTSYLIGVVGIWPDAYIAAEEQKLLLRQRGGHEFASAQSLNGWFVRTPRDVHDRSRGIGSLFVMPLKPGRYELFNVWFDTGRTRSWSREDFSIPLNLEAGKAYYIGDFRSACIIVGNACTYFHSRHPERDLALARAAHPELPSIEELDLKYLDGAYPTIIDQNGPKASVYRALMSGELQ
ncbi:MULTISPECIES: hypothetical protein [Pseudomonas]|uniref:hypothetical protein n=1 Tax=Pseudomonas TaxID=286 RepID=UPI001BCEC9B2|nr:MULTISPECIES: hypothetical protein [Pseudomonas]UXY50980.1 hypothetical protein N9L84_18640 [Pseudomonas tohonis]